MNYDHSWLEQRRKNIDKIKQRQKEYEIEQKAIYACEIQREKDRKWLYRFKKIKFFFKRRKYHSFGGRPIYPKYTTKSKRWKL